MLVAAACLCICLQLAGQLRSLHKLPVGYVALDWHQMDKELGSEALVEAFWTQLSALLPPQVKTLDQAHNACLQPPIHTRLHTCRFVICQVSAIISLGLI